MQVHGIQSRKKCDKTKNPHTGGWSDNVLFSHGAAPALSSELEGLAAVFGMGTGVFIRRFFYGTNEALSRSIGYFSVPHLFTMMHGIVLMNADFAIKIAGMSASTFFHSIGLTSY